MRRGIGRLRAGGGGFSPISVFAGSAAGLWLDPSDITTGYVDSAGTTPQTASGQQTGLRLDKRASPVQKLTDPEFDNPAVWSPSSGAWVVSGGVCTVTGAASLSGIAQTAGVTGISGKWVKCTWTISSFSAGGIKVYAGGTFGITIAAAPGTYTEFLLAGANGIVQLLANGTTTGVVSRFSVELVDGNHVLQATAGSRPEYDVLSNISSDFFDGIDDILATAGFIAGTLTSNMDCFAAIKAASAVNGGLVGFDVVGSRYFGLYGTGANVAQDAVTRVNTTTYVNGVLLAGGAGTNETAINTAIGTTWAIVEIRNLDMSAWLSFKTGFYAAGHVSNQDCGGIILCPAQSSTNRDSIRKWLGAKVGLSL